MKSIPDLGKETDQELEALAQFRADADNGSSG